MVESATLDSTFETLISRPIQGLTRLASGSAPGHMLENSDFNLISNISMIRRACISLMESILFAAY